MRIRFARYQDQKKAYTAGFWLCFILGGLTAITSGEHGSWVSEFLLAAAFVCLWGMGAARIQNDYGAQEFEEKEISSDEYIALNARLNMYPDAKEEVAKLVPKDGHINYRLSFEIEELINRHAYGVKSLRDDEVREQEKSALVSGLGKTA